MLTLTALTLGCQTGVQIKAYRSRTGLRLFSKFFMKKIVFLQVRRREGKGKFGKESVVAWNCETLKGAAVRLL